MLLYYIVSYNISYHILYYIETNVFYASVVDRNVVMWRILLFNDLVLRKAYVTASNL